MGLLDFHSIVKILFGVYLKRSSFWSSADGKLMPNDLVNSMHWQSMYALSISALQSMDILKPTAQNMGQSFNCRCCFACACLVITLMTKTA